MNSLSRISARYVLATAAASGLLAGVTAPPSLAAPTPQACLDETFVSTYSSTGGPFSGGTRLSWSAMRGCSNVTFKLRGEPVEPTGSKLVNPTSTAQYELSAHVQGLSKVFSSQYPLAGNVVGHTMTYTNDWVPVAGDYTGRGAAEARVHAARVTDSLSPQARSRLLGKVLQLHLIPEGADLTQLYPWQHLKDTSTCDRAPADRPCVNDREYNTLRAVGGELYGTTDRIVFATGVETVVQPISEPYYLEFGHFLIHELGHTILDFATAPAFKESIAALLAQRGPNAQYPGPNEYARSNADEYWAQGTAALFGTGGPRNPVSTVEQAQAAEFSTQWLQTNDPTLLSRLRLVYPNAT